MSGHLRIFRVLDASSRHLTADTREDLNGIDGVSAYDMPDGWLMYANPDSTDLAEENEWPTELLPVVSLALDNECDYIWFGRESETLAGFPLFD